MKKLMMLMLGIALVLVSAPLSCEWSNELQSDPSAWSPRPEATSEPDATNATEDSSTIDPACSSGALPPFDPTLRTSTATAVSHGPGLTCLEGCHALQGEARTAFTAAGTIYRSQTSREIAGAGGTVEGVGGTILTVDKCGNFYAVAGAVEEKALRITQPFVQSPTVHRMEKTLSLQTNPGDCNQLGCHDFSAKLRWGIYY